MDNLEEIDYYGQSGYVTPNIVGDGLQKSFSSKVKNEINNHSFHNGLALKEGDDIKLLDEAMKFSMFALTYNNETNPRSAIDSVPGLYEEYLRHDDFIKAAYLKGLELGDPTFITDVHSVFPMTHHRGLTMRKYLNILVDDKNIIELFEKYGQQYIEICQGIGTEFYKQWSCKAKSSVEILD